MTLKTKNTYSISCRPRNMCRIMYFQSGIGATQQRLKLPDGRLVQVEGPDASKSLVTWMLPAWCHVIFITNPLEDFFIATDALTLMTLLIFVHNIKLHDFHNIFQCLSCFVFLLHEIYPWISTRLVWISPCFD